MNYKEYMAQKSAEIEALPIFFAFTQEQFDEALKERNAVGEKVYRMGNGGFYLAKYAQTIRDYVNKPDPIHELMQDHDFAVEAFEYEMFNHEYCYNPYEGNYDVIAEIFGSGSIKFDDLDDYVQYFIDMGHTEYIPYYREALRNYNNKMRDCI